MLYDVLSFPQIVTSAMCFIFAKIHCSKDIKNDSEIKGKGFFLVIICGSDNLIMGYCMLIGLHT